MNKRQRKKRAAEARRDYEAVLAVLAEHIRRASSGHMTEAELIVAAEQGKRERRARNALAAVERLNRERYGDAAVDAPMPRDAVRVVRRTP